MGIPCWHVGFCSSLVIAIQNDSGTIWGALHFIPKIGPNWDGRVLWISTGLQFLVHQRVSTSHALTQEQTLEGANITNQPQPPCHNGWRGKTRTQESHGSWSLSLLFLHELIICWSIRVFPLLGGPDLQLAGCDKGWPDNSFIVPAPGSHLLGSTKAIARCAPFRRTLRQENRYLLHKGWWSFWCGFPRKTHQNKGKSSQNIMSSWFLWMFQIHNIHQNEQYPNFRPATTPARPPKGPTAHVLFLTTEMSSLPESDLREIDPGTYWSFPEICMVTPTQPEPTFLVCFVVLWHAYAI